MNVCFYLIWSLHGEIAHTPPLVALPADFSVWAASAEASWLHGHFVWAHWDVNELKADKEFMKRLSEENGFLKVGVQGLTSLAITDLK